MCRTSLERREQKQLSRLRSWGVWVMGTFSTLRYKIYSHLRGCDRIKRKHLKYKKLSLPYTGWIIDKMKRHNRDWGEADSVTITHFPSPRTIFPLSIYSISHFNIRAGRGCQICSVGRLYSSWKASGVWIQFCTSNTFFLITVNLEVVNLNNTCWFDTSISR